MIRWVGKHSVRKSAGNRIVSHSAKCLARTRIQDVAEQRILPQMQESEKRLGPVQNQR